MDKKYTGPLVLGGSGQYVPEPGPEQVPTNIWDSLWTGCGGH